MLVNKQNFYIILFNQIDNLLDGYWYKHNATSPYQYNLLNRSRVHLLSQSQLQQCIHDQYHDSITAIGDSHVRFMFWYLMRELETPLPVAGSTMKLAAKQGSHSFEWTAYCRDLKRNLQRYIGSHLKTIENNPRRKFLVLLSGGSWEILFHSHTVWNLLSPLECIIYCTLYSVKCL